MVELLSKGFLLIPGFIERDRAISLGREFKEYANVFQLKDDMQVSDSKCCYNYKSFVELLCEKNNTISGIIGEPVLPTYTYSRVYQKNNTLKKHKDKAECEISVTVHMYGDKEWSFSLKDFNGNIHSVLLNPGDAVLYLGTELEHWRDSYDGDSYIQCFLHYVRSRGEYSHLYFDSRNREKNSTDLNNFIKVYEDIASNSFCDTILNEYRSDNWLDASTGNNNSLKIEKDFRNCKVLRISDTELIDLNYNNRKLIDSQIFECVGRSVSRYISEFPQLSLSSDTGYDLLKYEEGCFFSQHTDSYNRAPRTISCSLCLNDDYEGGEFAFFDNTFRLKPKRGSVIIFPSNFMFPHEILKVTRGVRYSIITWFN